MSEPTSVEDLKRKTEDVKSQMASNLQEVQRREDNVEQVAAASQQLSETSHLFQMSSRHLQRKYCFKNVKLWILLIVIISIILLTLIVALIIVITSSTSSSQ